MPAVIRKQTKYSPLQSFRAWSERILIEAAQLELHAKYPGTGPQPLRRGRLRSAIRIMFTTGFRVTPRPLRNWIMHRLLVRKGQDWDPA